MMRYQDALRVFMCTEFYYPLDLCEKRVFLLYLQEPD